MNWSFGSGYNTQENGRVGANGLPFWPIPPLLASNFGSTLEKMSTYNNDPTRVRNDGVRDKICRGEDSDHEMKPGGFHSSPRLVVELGFGPQESDVKSNHK